jgi:hypothetical protein
VSKLKLGAVHPPAVGYGMLNLNRRCGVHLEKSSGPSSAINHQHDMSADRCKSMLQNSSAAVELLLSNEKVDSVTLVLASVTESAFFIVETVCRKVKRWHGGDQRERWIGSGLLFVQKQFRRARGYKQIPELLPVLETLKPSTKSVTKRNTS